MHDPESSEVEALTRDAAPFLHRSKWRRKRCCILSSICIGVCVLAILIAVFIIIAHNSYTPKIVLYVIPDGFGAAHGTLTRQIYGTPSLDKLVAGAERTRSFNSLITDSAAAGSALATGHKTNNHMLSMYPNQTLTGTLMEAALAEGFYTGVIVKSPVPHATPAAFTAHHHSRYNMENIAKQQVMVKKPGRGFFDVMLGGGLDYFDAAKRADHLDLLAEARKRGFTVVHNKTALDNADKFPILGLFTPGQMTYALDRPNATAVHSTTAEPTLPDMLDKTLQLLLKASAGGDKLHKEFKGAVLMTECSMIDFAAHKNDAAGVAGEVQECDKTVRVALDFAAKMKSLRRAEVVIIIAPDHETGGLAMARGGLENYKPEVIARVRKTVKTMAARVMEPGASLPDIVQQGAGFALNAAELATLNPLAHSDNKSAFEVALGNVIAARADIAWTSSYHSGSDVLFWSNRPEIIGAHSLENTDIPKTLAKWLKVDLERTANEVRKNYQGWDFGGSGNLDRINIEEEGPIHGMPSVIPQ
eukprot:gnl/Trimastix_PCT/1637.p1 GENE.gnl/Trimastix_PCT/1637~~gnl/Trimastix_PCT/1637.p1  ORF type:complete len:531 (+),score=176.15 gnl/Trimastix_PCT/1637:58-1650(+)